MTARSEEEKRRRLVRKKNNFFLPIVKKMRTRECGEGGRGKKRTFPIDKKENVGE